ncbi:hypothetical protein DPMN_180068 [Dreissena polymorpha]|uniref:Uncharacterized protein n=1 Tax=Dreissena polymorpha TaxID=45954 RepID=A0A9D4EDH9_DREPO|nr:hypothetical protein DPMN_180068 [Dreissena polymorpha]
MDIMALLNPKDWNRMNDKKALNFTNWDTTLGTGTFEEGIHKWAIDGLPPFVKRKSTFSAKMPVSTLSCRQSIKIIACVDFVPNIYLFV